MEVISGVGHPACVDFTCINAGAILYLIDKTDSIKAGVETCREIIAGGLALKKLCEWISLQTDAMKSGVKRFIGLAGAAKLDARVKAWL